MGAYISKQVKMHAYHLNFETLNNEFCKFYMRKFQRNPSSGRPTWNGQYWNCFWKFFTFENFSSWAGRPWELGHLKNLCIFPPLSSAPSSPWPSKVVRFLTLPPFSRTPLSFYLVSSAPLSPRFLLNAPSNPHLFRARLWAFGLSFWARLQPLTSFKRAFEPSAYLF